MTHDCIMEQIYMLAAIRAEIKDDPRLWQRVKEIDTQLAELSQALPRD